MNPSVFVLGMHRSGTSAIAGLLKILGVDFGLESDLMPPSRYNQKGFFEHVPMNGINEEILRKFGGDWFVPPPFVEGWENSEELADLRRRAAEVVEKHFGRSKLWGFKDPRTCITFPFWRKVVQEKIKVVVVGRNPIDSARSIQDVQKILAFEASDLWFKYMVAAFLGSRGLRRHVVFYEDVLGNLGAELRRLASFIGVSISGQMADQAKKFMDKQLCHFESTVEDAVGGYGLAPKTRKAYLTIRAFADVAKAGQLEPVDEINIENVLLGIQKGT